MATTQEPEKKIEPGANLQTPEDEAAIRNSIVDQREQIQGEAEMALAENPVIYEMGKAHTSIISNLLSKTPNEKQIKADLALLQKERKEVIKEVVKGEKAREQVVNGPDAIQVESISREMEIIRADRAKAKSDKWLSWLGPLGRNGGEAIRGLVEGLAGAIVGAFASGRFAWKERKARHKKFLLDLQK
jgi:hypothetical protein